jgi:23S rRNA (uracil1939-C5)-methyltransferase
MERTTELFVEKIVAGGAGLAFLEGRAVFLPFAIPGETVSARIFEEGRDWLRAEIVDIRDPSPDRVEARCPFYGICGGCNLQHMSYDRQLAAKSSIVSEAFRRIAGFDPGEVPVAGSRAFGYRNRVQVHADPEGRLGFMRRDSRDIVPISSCPVADPAVNRWLESRAHSQHRKRELLSFSGGLDRFIVFGYGGEVFVEGRDREARVEVAGDEIRFSLKGFFQSNMGTLETLVRDAFPAGQARHGSAAAGSAETGLATTVADATSDATVPGPARAADLYCGVGLFGHFLAKDHETVLCVESEARSLECARVNLPDGSGEFYQQSVEAWVGGKRALGHFDRIVADPPRTGMATEVLQWLAQAEAPELVYISCDPATLARDARSLFKSGWRLASLKAYDFYPQTGHIECAARFER